MQANRRACGAQEPGDSRVLTWRTFARAELLAVVAGGFGLSVWANHGALPPGLHGGTPLSILATVATDSGFLLLVVASAVGLGALWYSIASYAARNRAVPMSDLLHATTPLPWGLAAPTAAIVLDAVSFWCSAPALLALGVGSGGIAAAWRMRRLGQAESDGRPFLAVVAFALPMALLPNWLPASGDEPHYLIVARSVLVDGDLDLAADYPGRAYEPFHPQALSPHTKQGLGEGSRYSMHGVGLPLFVLPAYALGGSLGPTAMVALPRGMLALAYGLFAWLLYGLIRDIAGDRAAFRGTAATTLLAPLLFSATFVFPEVPTMVLALYAYRGLRNATSPGRLALAGAALAALPWLGVKYIPIVLVVAATGVIRAAPAPRAWRLLACLGGLGVGLATHGIYTWVLYGTVSPAAIYLGSAPDAGAPALGGDWGAYVAQWPGALATLLGYLMDQKDGLLAYGPHFLLVAAGLPWLWRRRRADAVALAIVLAAYTGSYALSQQLSGQGPPVRPLMAVIWTLAPALGVALTFDAGKHRWYAALRGGLLALSGCLTVALAS